MNSFFQNQSSIEQEEYINLLKIIGSLSNIYTDNNIPYLYYRTMENIFCYAFNANNLSRSDISIDASKSKVGIGLKTYHLRNGNGFEKIAEFNQQSKAIQQLKTITEQVKEISRLRNERIKFTSNVAGVDKLLYHCIARDTNRFIIHESPLEQINIDSLKVLKRSENIISFQDGNNEYSFNFSKSTLFKRFKLRNIYEFDVDIFDNPFLLLKELYTKFNNLDKQNNPIIARVYLPLYSPSTKKVEEKSGLNQWNAGGRARHSNELYIPVPKIIHQKFPEFFPDRDTSFMIKLPDNTHLKVKICQDGGKALMSDPNKDLGEWILRKILNIKEGELVTMQHLQDRGIDSVEISKYKDGSFAINFKEIGTYEEFEKTLN